MDLSIMMHRPSNYASSYFKQENTKNFITPYKFYYQQLPAKIYESEKFCSACAAYLLAFTSKTDNKPLYMQNSTTLKTSA